MLTYYLLILFANGKSHTGFRLVPKVVILNNVMAVILHYFTQFGNFGVNYVRVLDVRSMLFTTRM